MELAHRLDGSMEATFAINLWTDIAVILHANPSRREIRFQFFDDDNDNWTSLHTNLLLQWATDSLLIRPWVKMDVDYTDVPLFMLGIDTPIWVPWHIEGVVQAARDILSDTQGVRTRSTAIHV
jgi:hypothetical protein